ncbi:MAG: chromosome segregation protein SMC, partial [Candidatus Latescibacteria bacterium]|nr:chromosome segregation protein SMC [Candidatus Latescibacterota bacterium]
MHLSRLTAVGFKSFAQRLDLPFQKGISCVVGPNGCGKSNVVDALRWALGEQRTRSLRSHHMEDVIFSGSRTRKPLGMAEVSVTIDNSTNLLPTDFSEITVTRRLFRSGESDYLLNKVPCRLKDIQNLFMDTGLGASHAYVIEQGMVDEIISDNPEERRRLFEEAAGVTRYKVRRRSAWNKLQSIQHDLEQIALLISEVERQVASLRRQERRARLYKQLTGELEDLDIQLARYRYFDMASRSEPMLEEIAFLKEDVEVGAVDITRLEAQIEETRAELAQQDQAVSDANAEVSRHVEVVHRKDREILVAREEARSIEAFLSRASQQQEELGTRREAARQQEEAAARGSSQAAESLAEAEGQLENQTADLESLLEALETSRAEAEGRNTRLISVLGEIREMNGSLERSRAELDGLSQRRSRLAEDAERVRARRAEADAAAADAAGRITQMEQEATQRTAQRAERAAARSRFQEERDRLAESHSALSARAESIAARLALLKRLREGFEGYSQGIRAVVIDSPFSDRVRGVVADLIDLDREHTAAIEAALGRALECLLVDSTADAGEAMAYLRSGGQGAAAFLPLDRVSHATGIPWDVPSGEGIIGRASDLLRNVRNGGGAIATLLRRVLVVSDLDAAAPLMSQMRSLGVDIVTLHGELLAADGTVYGGAAAGESTGLIGRAQEIESLEEQERTAREDLEDLGARIRRVSEDLAEVTSRIETDDTALAELQNRLAGLRSDLQNTQAEAHRQAEVAAELAEEGTRLQERETELKQAVDRAAAELEARDAARARLESETRTADESTREFETQRRAQQETVAGRRVEIASLRERVEALRQEAQRQKQSQTDLEGEMERLVGEKAQNSGRKAHLDELVTVASGELEGLHNTQTELE